MTTVKKVSRAIFDALASTFALCKKHLDEENEQAVEVVEYVLQNDFELSYPMEVVSLYYYNYTDAKMDILVDFTLADGSAVTKRFRFNTRGRPLTPPKNVEFCKSDDESDESDDDG